LCLPLTPPGIEILDGRELGPSDVAHNQLICIAEYRRGLSTPLRGPRVESQRGMCVVAYPHHLGVAHQEDQDPVAEGGVQSQGP
jgi:hypothetical protein